ncbi:MAG: hypothetical protein V1809_15710 [Planctomycetota bacterium]
MMNGEIKQRWHIVASGVLIGVVLGIEEVAVGSMLLVLAGRPYFLIRPGTEIENALAWACFGGIWGFAYGWILFVLYCKDLLRFRFLPIFLSVLVVSVFVYIPFLYSWIRDRKLGFVLAPDLIIFILAVLIAVLIRWIQRRRAVG